MKRITFDYDRRSVYPEFDSSFQIASNNHLNRCVEVLWNRLPAFKDRMSTVPTVHVPMSQQYINMALRDHDFVIQHKTHNYCNFYNNGQ